MSSVSGPGPTREGEHERERTPEPAERSLAIARDLTGDLPCADCRYNLRGLSVRGVCPECGLPIRATILARVDPYASVLRPVLFPKVTAVGLMLWSIGGLMAGLCVWMLRVSDGIVMYGGPPYPPDVVVLIGTAAVIGSGLGALALIRPHAGIPARQSAAALAAALATFVIAALYWRLHGVFDPSRLPPYFTGEDAARERTLMRLGVEALLVVVIVGLRPNARLLASRSLLLRSGRVDRQTMLAMLAAVGVCMAGDALHLVGPQLTSSPARVMRTLGDFFIAVGSMLITVGLVGVVIDCIRILPALLRRPISIGSVLAQADRAAEGPTRAGTEGEG